MKDVSHVTKEDSRLKRTPDTVLSDLPAMGNANGVVGNAKDKAGGNGG